VLRATAESIGPLDAKNLYCTAQKFSAGGYFIGIEAPTLKKV
jgi:hypothetical protein